MLRKKLVKYYVWGIVFYSAEDQILRKVDQKHLGNFKMWCWRRMGKINWTARVRNEEILHRAKEERNILHTVNRRKANWIDHVLRRSCLLKHVMEGRIEEIKLRTGSRGRSRKQVLDDIKEKKGYFKLKEEALDLALWRIRFGRGYGSVGR